MVLFVNTLPLEFGHFAIPAEQQDKQKRLYNAKSYLEFDLNNIHKNITDGMYIGYKEELLYEYELVWFCCRLNMS